MLYRLLFAAVFSRMDPERAHRLGFGAIRLLGRVPGAAPAVRLLCGPRDPALRVKALGMEFSGPFGLAAGFDKNAAAVPGLAALGFAFVEVGTVTAQPQPGNPEPRLFRLPQDRALVNRMGFNNDGAHAVAARLTRWRLAQWRRGATSSRTVLLGVNIGKTKAAPDDEAVSDYVASARVLAPLADYLVVNVSSPNTPGLRDLQTVSVLRPLLVAVRGAADDAAGRPVPLLVKIAPDLADEDVDAIADLADDIGLDGIVAVNTTVRRDGLATPAEQVEALGAGGLSGPVLRERSLEVLRRLRARVGEEMTIIAVGGITTPEDAAERLDAGATLLQGYTGFIYQGPLWARRINRGLSRRAAARSGKEQDR
jgi:dihydroorotate dehydrogenase